MAAIWMKIAFILSIFGTSLSCNSGWSAFGGSCYKVSQHLFSHILASRYCQLAGGSLARANGSEILQFFNRLPNFNGKEEYWLEKDSWSEASTTVGHATEEPDPSQQSVNPGCPYAKIMDIRMEFCNVNKFFICETKENTLNCPMGFDKYDSYCYIAISHPANYDEASKFCVLHKGQLAILDSEDKEWKAKNAVIGKNLTFVVGAKMGENGIMWSNGRPFTTATAEDFANQTIGMCLGLLSETLSPTIFSWKLVDCDEKSSYICEAQPIPTTTTEVPTTRPPPPPPLQCPHGSNWKAHNVSGTCFWETTYETDTLNWYQAREFCQMYGGDLASYISESQEITGLAGARGHYRGLWIGLKRDENNVFYWADGTTFNYTNWEYGQPNLRSVTKFCATHSGNLQGKWELDYCGVRRWFVCKAPMVRNQIIPTLPERKEKCEVAGVSAYRNQWYRYKDHCYLLHEFSSYTWDTARLFCQDNGGLLASVHSFNETNFILTLTSKSPDSNFWIGLSAHGLESSYIWSDGTALEFAYWKEDKSEAEGLNTCVNFNKKDGSWDVTHCNRLLGVICKRGINSTYDLTTTEPPAVMPGNCQNGWYNYGNKCYKPFATKWSQRVNWNTAKQACDEMGASLVSIHSQGEQDMLTDVVMEEVTDLWIGLQSKEAGTVFHWSDESRMDYTNWGENQPHYISDTDLFMTTRPNELCVIMEYNELSMGKWDDIHCGEKRGYVCEKYKDPTLTVPYKDPFACSNITGWYKLGSSCYGFFEQQEQNWLDAQRECRKYGADLITFKNIGVPVFIKRKLKLKNTLFWIGVREKTQDKYESVTGTPLFYANWKTGQPVAASTFLDNCVATYGEGGWVVRSCKEKLPFICRLSRDTDAQPSVDTPSRNCEDMDGEWYDFGGDRCYLFQFSMRKSWGNAMQYCFKLGGSLVSVHSASDFVQLKEKIGPVLTRSIHIGLGKKFDGSFAWVDGSPVDYTAWDEDEPDTNLQCAGMSMLSFKWHTLDCDESFRGFICSFTKKKSPTIPVAKNFSMAEETKKEGISHKLTAAGIFGIVLCILVVLAVIGVTVYYLRPKKEVQPQLLETDAL